MRRGLYLLLIVVVVAIAATCSSSGTERPLIPEPNTPINSARCRELNDKLQEALAKVTGSCESDTDCELIGGQTGGTPTCDCAPYVLDCGGMPVPKNATGMDDVTKAVQDFKAEGCASGAACDCGPRGPLKCSVDKRCVAEARSCIGELPDEGW
jgi:hypothetical protein